MSMPAARISVASPIDCSCKLLLSSEAVGSRLQAAMSFGGLRPGHLLAVSASCKHRLLITENLRYIWDIRRLE